ncbi:MBL fold metallo-hydrolase, partial [Enterocloster hominis (ex Hitch et al. 2024)]
MARFEHVAGNTGCLSLKGNCIPVYCMTEKEWIIMDSGSRFDRDELIHYLKEHTINIKAVLTSHAHYDHVGNHAVLQEMFGCE